MLILSISDNIFRVLNFFRNFKFFQENSDIFPYDFHVYIIFFIVNQFSKFLLHFLRLI